MVFSIIKNYYVEKGWSAYKICNKQQSMSGDTYARAGAGTMLCKTFYTSLISLAQCVNAKHASHMQNIIDRLIIF